jgi:hypothetical protein
MSSAEYAPLLHKSKRWIRHGQPNGAIVSTLHWFKPTWHTKQLSEDKLFDYLQSSKSIAFTENDGAMSDDRIVPAVVAIDPKTKAVLEISFKQDSMKDGVFGNLKFQDGRLNDANSPLREAFIASVGSPGTRTIVQLSADPKLQEMIKLALEIHASDKPLPPIKKHIAVQPR